MQSSGKGVCFPGASLQLLGAGGGRAPTALPPNAAPAACRWGGLPEIMHFRMLASQEAHGTGSAGTLRGGQTLRQQEHKHIPGTAIPGSLQP